MQHSPKTMKVFILAILLISSLATNLSAQKVYKREELITSRNDKVQVLIAKTNNEAITGLVRIIESPRKYIIALLNNGIYNGEYQEFVNGKLANTGQYKEGRKVKTWTEYNPEGSPRRIAPYHEGELNGNVLYYYTNGNIERQISYNQGKKEGEEVAYGLDGQKVSVRTYRNDTLHGPYWTLQKASPDLVVVTKREYVNGAIHGLESIEFLRADGTRVRLIEKQYQHGKLINSKQTP